MDNAAIRHERDAIAANASMSSFSVDAAMSHRRRAMREDTSSEAGRLLARSRIWHQRASRASDGYHDYRPCIFRDE